MSPRSLSRLALFGLATCLQIGLVGLVDYFTGPDLGFFVFYFLPVGYAAWKAGRLGGSIAAFLAAFIWWLAWHMAVWHELSIELELWNTGIRLVAFLAFAMSFARIRELLEVERELSARLQASLDEVRELSGLLPICAACKKIRDDTGYWQQIESYISTHSRAEFTHGICPECARRLYPEYFGGSRDQEKGKEEKPSEGPGG